MEISWKTCVRVGISAFLLFLGITYWHGAVGLVSAVVGAALPLVIGGAAAYILNILMSFYERHYFAKSTATAVAKSRRPVCMILSILTLTVIVAGIIVLVVPQLMSAVQVLWAEVPGALEKVSAWLQGIEWLPQEMKNLAESIDWRSKLGELARFLSSGIGSVAGMLVSTVSSVFSGAVTTLISAIFTIYLLSGKEKLGRQCHRLMRFVLRGKWYGRVCHVLNILDDSFRRYIVGQCTEALILGALCTVGMLILQFPYATMVGALVAFTALIPVAGAYIGAGVGAFMILTVSPIKALGFLVFLVVLQQLEGNIIYPRVVGSSIGLPGIWVLAAVTIGGSLMGILGMLLAVPLAAAGYRLLKENVP